MVSPSTGPFRFENFVLDIPAGELRRNGEPVALAPQQFTVLSVLVESAGALVTREQLRERLWGTDVTVDFDAGLNFCVRQLRLALGDSATRPHFVQTVPRRGYRFIAPVAGPDAATVRIAQRPPWRHAALVVLAVVVSGAFGWYVDARAARVPSDIRIADAHAARGFVALNDDWEWTLAERAFTRAIQLDPQHEVALISLSRLHSAQGRAEPAVAFARRAVEAHPASTRARSTLGWALLFSGDARAAATVCAAAEQESPASSSARTCYLHAAAELGLAGRETWERALARLPQVPDPGSWFLRATVEARAGRGLEALESLQRALAAREPDASFALVHPALASLRTHSAFLAATRAAGLGEVPSRDSATRPGLTLRGSVQ